MQKCSNSSDDLQHNLPTNSQFKPELWFHQPWHCISRVNNSNPGPAMPNLSHFFASALGCEKESNEYFRFSRHSMQKFCDFTAEFQDNAEDEFQYIALCRVLISNVMNSSSQVIDMIKFEEARKLGIDAIYCTPRFEIFRIARLFACISMISLVIRLQ